MSRRHVLFEVSGDQCRVEDLESRNGVFVNDVRVTRAKLEPGDVVRAGHTVLRYSVAPRRSRRAPGARHGGGSPAFSATTTAVHIPKKEPVKSAPPATPRTFAGFEILGEIARGGLGVVYRARERDSGRIVALKAMLGSREMDEVARAHFVREMSILSDLHHPNVVRTYDVGVAAGEMWISMEYVDGTNLEQFVRRRGPLEPRECISIGIQLLRGLRHAHERAFVHRDVKPANALIAVQGGQLTAKLADFGLAKSLQSVGQTGLTVTGDAKGSPWFVAPEQLEDAKNVDYRADLYSLAATLSYAATGRWHLRKDGNFKDFLVSMIKFDYVPIGQRARVPQGLARVVDAALSRDPDDRPPSAREMEHVLVATARQLS
jgi:serine/threonine protein kinase